MRGKFFAALVIGWLILSSISFSYFGGSGTSTDPYQITSKTDLLELAGKTGDYSKYFILAADIDMEGQVFTSTLIAPDTNPSNGFQGTAFTGTFDGKGHKITNFTINGGSKSYIGLFGYVGFSHIGTGQIIKLGIENCMVSGTSYVGGLAGFNAGGSISDCYSTGSTISGSYAGGLVGCNGGTGSIYRCYSTSSVTGASNVGGLVGYKDNLSATVISSFWDTQTSGRTTSAGGTDKTTAQMKTQSTFTSAGWDFVNTWFMPSNDYPRLIGLSLTTVPDVIGMTQIAAQTAITAAGLTVGSITQAFSDSVPAGNVISQSPAAGTTVGVGSLVNLVVSLGIAVAVPDVVGMSQTEAQSAIISAGLIVGTVKTVYANSIPEGNIISQLPTTGTLVPVGAAVNLVISLGNNGRGTVQDPYQITSKADLLVLAADTGNYNKSFILTADIDMEGQVFTTAIIAPDTNNNTSGFQGAAFTGIFDGNGHKITNCTINGGSNWYLGLFGYVDSSGQIKNLTIGDSIISGSQYVGGLAGLARGTISFCSAMGAVSGSEYVGGLIGYNSSGSVVSYCYATGAVTGSIRYIGGLIGLSYLAVSYCYATGSVSGISNTEYIGGLMGENYGSVNSCYATGVVTGGSRSKYLGGLMGESMGGSVSNCYATGSVSGGSGSVDIGGLIGYLNDGGTVNCCYATGLVSSYSSGGGLISSCAYRSGPVTNCFWDVQTSGQTTSAGGTGKTTEEMKILSTFASVGWDFSPSWIDGDFQDWIFISEGKEYPKLKCQFPPTYSGGSGNQANPYQIADANDLLSLADTPGYYLKRFILTADIDLEGQVFTAAVIAPDISSSSGFQGTSFTGVMDGAGHKIFNFTINSPTSSGLGLFGQIGIFDQIDSAGTVKNLGVENFTINGGSDVGGLIGCNYLSNIDHCYSKGIVNGTSSVGGLIGTNSRGNINFCYAAGSVGGSLGSQNVGGLIGIHFGTVNYCYSAALVAGDSNSQYLGGLTGRFTGSSINNSYAIGSVDGGTNSKYVGGLVGYNGGSSGGTINQCYSIGAVSGTSSVGGLVGDNYNGNAKNSFWDMETSGQTTSDSGTGKTTAQMKTLSMFTLAGWDFINGTNDNLEHTWFIHEGQEYPRLLWEIENGQSGLFPEGFVTINKTRVGRTSFEYELAVTVRNSNAFAMNNVQMKLMDWDAAVQSVSDDSITIDTIPAGATLTSTDTFKIVVDRSTLINSSRLTWELTYYTVASGDQVQQAMMSMLLSDIEAGVPGDISGDGKVNLEDLAVMSAQWNTTPGNPSADIAPPLDDYVGIEDLMYLADNWLR